MKLFDNFLGAIFLTASVQGLLLGIVLLFLKKGARLSNILLGFLTLLFSLDIFYYVFNWSRWHFNLIHLNAFAEAFPLLYGPLFFLYFAILEKGKFKAVYLLHFLPFVLALLYYLPFYLLNAEAKKEFMIALTSGISGQPRSIINYAIHYGKLVSILSYASLVAKYLFDERRKLNKYATELEKVKINWIKNLTVFFLIFASAYFAYYALVQFGLLKPAYDYAIAVIMCSCIYLIAYNGFRQPSIFLNMTQSERKKYEKTLLNDDFVERTKLRVLSLLELKKPYLKNDLKIQELADMLQISSHQLSQVINKEFGQVFTDFINTYRIEEAKRLLSDKVHNDDKILKIALESGFGNKVSFNMVFKKLTGMTPTSYRDEFGAKGTTVVNPEVAG